MKTRNSGFTLAEVLVSIVIGVISIAAAFASYNYFNKSYKSVSQKAAINSAARDALTVIARDLRNAGYIDINFTRDSRPEIKLINLRQKYLGNLDSLAVWYTTSPNDRMRVYYRPMKYRNSNKMYLAREVVMNPVTVGKVIYEYYKDEFISVKGIKAQGNQLTPHKVKQVNLLNSLEYIPPFEKPANDIEVVDEDVLIDSSESDESTAQTSLF